MGMETKPGTQKIATRSEASKREYEIKKLKRHEKKSLLLLFNVST
jgi:predicted GIY-YIG superfamily endonuclease